MLGQKKEKKGEKKKEKTGQERLPARSRITNPFLDRQRPASALMKRKKKKKGGGK